MQPLPAKQSGKARVATATPQQAVIPGIDCWAMLAPGTGRAVRKANAEVRLGEGSSLLDRVGTAGGTGG